jgi:hypothetical protein
MRPSPGYSVPEGMICHLQRSFYGLKQAPRAWLRLTNAQTRAHHQFYLSKLSVVDPP